MSRGYSTKEICEIFNIGRETLRHYENVGLIHPEINPQNGYREYGYWDVGVLVDALKFRKADYSLNQIKKALYETDYMEVLDSLEKQHEYFTDQLIRYRMLDNKVSFDLKYLRQVRDKMNEVIEGHMNEMFYVPYTNSSNEKLYTAMKQVFDESFFFSTTWIMREDYTGENPLEGLGFATEKKYADYLGIKCGITLPETDVVGTVWDLSGRVPVTKKLIEDFERDISEKYPAASEETYVLLMSRFFDKEQTLHQYIYVYKTI
ncbi:MAG: MerR family transcriptional regulator [Lachnospiraceae bacterium]|nr:MerR family transcriptional regulator [Lachnospiraceae bacterium]